MKLLSTAESADAAAPLHLQDPTEQLIVKLFGLCFALLRHTLCYLQQPCKLLSEAESSADAMLQWHACMLVLCSYTVCSSLSSWVDFAFALLQKPPA